LEYLAASLRYILHYSKKHGIPIPEREKIVELMDKLTAVENKLPTEYQQRNKTHRMIQQNRISLFLSSGIEIVLKNKEQISCIRKPFRRCHLRIVNVWLAKGLGMWKCYLKMQNDASILYMVRDYLPLEF